MYGSTSVSEANEPRWRSNPAGRARNLTDDVVGGLIYVQVPGFEPAKEAVRTAAKRRRICLLWTVIFVL